MASRYAKVAVLNGYYRNLEFSRENTAFGEGDCVRSEGRKVIRHSLFGFSSVKLRPPNAILQGFLPAVLVGCCASAA